MSDTYLTNFTAEDMDSLPSSKDAASNTGQKPSAESSASLVYTTAPENQYGRVASQNLPGGTGPAQEEQPGDKPAVKEKPQSDGWAEVKDGTVDEIVDWAGDDKKRAQKAIRAEEKKEEPRSTLVTRLQAKVDG